MNKLFWGFITNEHQQGWNMISVKKTTSVQSRGVHGRLEMRQGHGRHILVQAERVSDWKQSSWCRKLPPIVDRMNSKKHRKSLMLDGFCYLGMNPKQRCAWLHKRQKTNIINRQSSCLLSLHDTWQLKPLRFNPCFVILVSKHNMKPTFFGNFLPPNSGMITFIWILVVCSVTVSKGLQVPRRADPAAPEAPENEDLVHDSCLRMIIFLNIFKLCTMIKSRIIMNHLYFGWSYWWIFNIVQDGTFFWVYCVLAHTIKNMSHCHPRKPWKAKRFF